MWSPIDLLDQSQAKCNRQFPVNFEKYDIFDVFENLDFFNLNSSDNICMLMAWLVSSTSPTGGNQVDGLSPASS